MGYVVCGMRNSSEAQIGDTFYCPQNPVQALPGFKPTRPMVKKKHEHTKHKNVSYKTHHRVSASNMDFVTLPFVGFIKFVYFVCLGLRWCLSHRPIRVCLPKECD